MQRKITEADQLRDTIRTMIRNELKSRLLEADPQDDESGDDIFAGSGEKAPAQPSQEPVASTPEPAQTTPPDKAPPGTNVKGKVTLSKVSGGSDGGAPGQGDADDLKDVTLDKVVDKINAMRSGKSLKDQEVETQLKAYFEDLNNSERTALYAFLKGLSQIVTGVVPGDQATEPGEPPADVKMTKAGDTRHVKPTVIHKGGDQAKDAAGKPPAQEDKEDTTPPVVAKKR